MELSHSLRLRQQLKLVMTPQLQQVIKLLQLPITDLVELVQSELQANPMLEEGISDGSAERMESKTQELPPEENMDAWLALAAEQGPRDSRDRDREAELARLQENRISPPPTLQDHLLDQLPLIEAAESELELARFLIGNLDDNGYLMAPLDELSRTHGTDGEALERALSIVQSLDPAGIGARSLKECLLLQLSEGDSREGGPVGPPEDAALARRIVSEHLESLERIRRQGAKDLAKKLGVGMEQAERALRIILACDPKPGSRFAEAPPAVIPEARIEKIGDDYVVVLNDAGLPPLRLSQAYREMLANRNQLKAEARRYLKERFRAAVMLMRGIEQRRVTLAKTLGHIVVAQRDFLDYGPARLKPLTLKEVADAVGVHESTVSRVVANKYVDTPRGIYALRDFFSNRVPSASASGTSAAAVRQRLKEIIESENPQSPLSDDQLAVKLREEGIGIARRTVTKYRELLKQPPAWQRRTHGQGPGV